MLVVTELRVRISVSIKVYARRDGMIVMPRVYFVGRVCTRYIRVPMKLVFTVILESCKHLDETYK
jgi:hypothetical protein